MRTQTHTRYVILCIAGGCVIGTRNTNDDGLPFNGYSAKQFAMRENERSEYKRANKLPGAFYYAVHKFERATA